jgi:rSAM/selenodomain-associated transferase 1
MSDARVIILCKAPVAGAVKTRLMPAYTAAQAADLHAAMARRVAAHARSLFADVRVAADDVTHPFFASLGLPVVPQGDGDLGQRMAALSLAAFRESALPLLLIGTDAPHMPSSRLLAAAAHSARYAVVLGPVEDGGYDLIACRGHHPELFAGIRWGSGRVLADTLGRIEGLGLSHTLLDVSFDIDRPEDVARGMAAGWRP